MRRWALLLAAVGVTGCMSGRTPARSGPGEPGTTRHGTLTGAEIARLYHNGNLLDALRGLRPLFLAPRRGDGHPVVYLDHLPLLGGVSDLGTIRTAIVAEVRFLTPNEATVRFGTGHMAGAIVVVLRRGPDVPWDR